MVEWRVSVWTSVNELEELVWNIYMYLWNWGHPKKNKWGHSAKFIRLGGGEEYKIVVMELTRMKR